MRKQVYRISASSCPGCNGSGKRIITIWDSSAWKKDMFRAANEERGKDEQWKDAEVTCPDCNGSGEVKL